MNYNFIIAQPFTGNALSVIDNLTGLTPSSKLTFEQFAIKEAIETGRTVKLVTADEMQALHDAHFITEWKEITEEAYTNMLECLPPMKWTTIGNGVTKFFCMEAMSGIIHGCYLADKNNNTYWQRYISRFTPDDEIMWSYIYKTT